MTARTLSRTLLVGALATLAPVALVAQATKAPAAKKAPAAHPHARPDARPDAKAPAAHTHDTPGAGTMTALPAARTLIDKYVAAIGGREAIVKRTSSRTTGNFEIPAAGMKADVVVLKAAPNRMAMTMTLPGMGEIQQGFDGTTAWAIDPNSGPRVLAGKEAAQAQSQADFLSDLHEARQYTSMETVAKADFEGRPAYEVKLLRTSGEEVREFFDVETGLLSGSQTTAETPMGAITVTTVFKDYKAFGGVLSPTRSVQRANGQEFIITITNIEHDVVDAKAFELPAPIKALATTPAPAK